MAKKKSPKLRDVEKELKELEKSLTEYSTEIEKAFKQFKKIKAPEYPPRYGPSCFRKYSIEVKKAFKQLQEIGVPYPVYGPNCKMKKMRMKRG
jgi:hypothetical protein